ncbi:Uncharacterised protein [Candidatus Gugararchaeum adminiculabundum]|nr:Uncharacterised protein [Candidatus Gugararchaeum adminiculabundum]
MENSKAAKIIYSAFVIVLILWIASIVGAAYIAKGGDTTTAGVIYAFHRPLCHQLPERSICVFDSGRIGECAPNGEAQLAGGEIVYAGFDQFTMRPREVVWQDGERGYEFAECARDTAIYVGVLLGFLILPLIKKIDSLYVPRVWPLILAMVPIGMDGGTQLLGWRESTDTLRIITGLIVGIVLPFYIMPMANRLALGLFSKKSGKNGSEKINKEGK